MALLLRCGRAGAVLRAGVAGCFFGGLVGSTALVTGLRVGGLGSQVRAGRRNLAVLGRGRVWGVLTGSAVGTRGRGGLGKVQVRTGVWGTVLIRARVLWSFALGAAENSGLRRGRVGGSGGSGGGGGWLRFG